MVFLPTLIQRGSLNLKVVMYFPNGGPPDHILARAGTITLKGGPPYEIVPTHTNYNRVVLVYMW